MDNTLLAYVKESMQGTAQIHQLSELTLFGFDLKYLSGKTNLVANALSYYPSSLESSLERNDEDDQYKSISYSMVCQPLGGDTAELKLERKLR